MPSDRSWENAREAEIVAQVLSALRASSTVGKAVMVVTFYKAQQRLLRDVLALHGFTERVDDDGVGGPRLRIVTVDQAQGSEADVVVLSCVRSNRRRITGFVGTRSSPNRFNVAITRARDRLVVVGDYATLSVDSVWGALHRAAMKLSADELPPLPPPPPA